ncbi:ubiquinone anaerobic biosynthesis accessory factor UbiT [Arenibaculum pallidiluteum]|uniref:ubiquinone anaerobic biosynthesis accessory factor UbiT n=1 Tax=Arenibaculum pallidiluteum TaxID=2812559 RepID=UPI001A968B35|nr:SCP2 sterol-binding domain-containing protein [Arenibaculum pallidiluteum]
MTYDAARPTPLSWTLLAGPGLLAVPRLVAQPALDAAMSAMRRRHPEVFERLAVLDEAEFLVDPVDLPVHFRLRPAGRAPRLSIGRGEPAGGCAAALRAPLSTLLRLLEGRIDGDAAFFGRDLLVEGDMAAVLILRNALDSGEVRLLSDLLAALGPLAGPARALGRRIAPVAGIAERALAALQAAVLQPHAERLLSLDDRVEALRDLASRGRGRHGSERTAG